jgi:hypothetical protein
MPRQARRLVGNLEQLRSFAYAGHSVLLGAVDRAWQATEEVLGRFGNVMKAPVKTGEV